MVKLNLVEKKELIWMKILLLVKDNIPTNKLLAFVFLFLKVIGLTIISLSMVTRSSSQANFLIWNLSDILKEILIFNTNLNRNIFNSLNYDALCFISYFFLLISVFPAIFIYRFNSRKSIKKMSSQKFSKFEKIILTFSAYILILILFFSQHIIEALSIIFMSAYTSTTTNIANLTLLNSYLTPLSTLIFPVEFYYVLNSIFIIAVNFISFVFYKTMVNPFISISNNFNFPLIASNKLFLLLLICLQNFQAVSIFELVLSDTNKWMIRLVYNSVGCIYCGIFIWITVSNYTTINTFLTNWLLFYLHICMFSCIVNTFTYYVSGEDEILYLTWLKYSVVVFISLSGVCCLLMKRESQFLQEFEDNLFLKQKKIKTHSIVNIMCLLKESIKGRKSNIFFDNEENILDAGEGIIKICSAIFYHKVKCADDECGCYRLELDNINECFKSNREILNLNDKLRIRRFTQIYKELIVFLENEIVNTISDYYNGEKNGMIHQLILLHIDILYYFKGNTLFTNYIMHQYLGRGSGIYKQIDSAIEYDHLSSNHNRKLSFFCKFYIYTYQKKIISDFKQTMQRDFGSESDTPHHQATQSSQRHLVKFSKFLDYFKKIENLKLSLSKNIDNFTDVMKLKKFYDSVNENATRKININAEGIFKTTKSLVKNFEKLVKGIKETFARVGYINNPEILYMFSFFFKITNKNIPYELAAFFKQEHPEIEGKKIISSFSECGMNYPMIVTAEKTETFRINYICHKLCEELDYSQQELLNEDFHLLMPKHLVEEHKKILRKSIFIQNKSVFHRDMFLISKNGYYIPAQVYASFIPSLMKNMVMIVNFKIHQNFVQKKNLYLFLLDINSEILSHSKNFEDNYMINYELIKTLRLDFNNLFNIDGQKILSVFKERILKVEKLRNDNCDDITRVFRSVDLEWALKTIRKSGVSAHDSKKELKVKLGKRKMNETLEKIKRGVIESSLDRSWIQNIEYFESKLNYYLTSTKKIKINSGLIKALDSSDITCHEFYFIFELHNIGSVPFFFVQMIDPQDYTIFEMEKTQLNYIKNKSYKTNLNYEGKNMDLGIKSKNTAEKLGSSDLVQNKIIYVTETLQHKEQKSLDPGNFYANISQSNSINLNNVTGANANLSAVNNTTTNANNISTLQKTIANIPLVRKRNLADKIKYNHDNILGVGHNLSDKRKNGTKSKSSDIKQDIKSVEKKQKVLLIILIILLFTHFILSILNYVIKQAMIKSSENIFYINYYALLTKSTVIYASSLIVDGCTLAYGIDQVQNYTNYDISLAWYRDKSEVRSQELYKYFLLLQDHLESADASRVSQINAIFSTEENYKLLFNDWTIYTRTNSFQDEFQRFTYYISSLQQNTSFKGCDLNMFFDSKIFQTNSWSSEASSDDETLFYVIVNVITKFRTHLENMTQITISVLLNYHSSFKTFLVIFNLVWLCLGIILLIVLYSSLMTFTQAIKELVLEILKSNKEDKDFLTKLDLLKEVAANFDKFTVDSLENYVNNLKLGKKEYEKESIDGEDTSQVHKLEGGNTFKNSASPATKASPNAINTAKPLKSTNRPSFSIIENYNFIGSQGGLYSNTNNRYDPVSNQQVDRREQLILHLSTRKHALILTFSALIFYLLISITNITIDVSTLNTLIVGNELSINFHDRIYDFSYLLLYYKISIMLNNSTYVAADKNTLINTATNSNNNSYTNYFNVNFGIQSDSLFMEEGGSEFSRIYYNFLIDEDNVEILMSDTSGQYSGVLKLTRQFESAISDGGMCVRVGEYYQNYFLKKNFTNSVDAFDSIDTIVKQCDLNLNYYGFSQSVDVLLNNIRSTYIDFFKLSPQESSKVENIINILAGSVVIESVINNEFTYKKMLDTLMALVLEDMLQLYSAAEQQELMFSVLGMIFDFWLILILLFIVLKKLNNYIDYLKRVINRFAIIHTI